MLKTCKDSIDKEIYRKIIKEDKPQILIVSMITLILFIWLSFKISNYYLIILLFLISMFLLIMIEIKMINIKYTHKIWLKYGGNLSYLDVILYQNFTSPGNIKLIFDHHKIKLLSTNKEIVSIDYQEEIIKKLKKKDNNIYVGNNIIDKNQKKKITAILNENYPIANAYTYYIPLLKPVSYEHPLNSFFLVDKSLVNKHLYKKVIVIFKREYWENYQEYKSDLEIDGVYFNRTPTFPCYLYKIGQINSNMPIFIAKHSLKDWFVPLTKFELTKYRKIIFVEGPTDVSIFNSFAKKLNINLEENKVCFKSLDGVNNLKFLAIQSFLETIKEINIQIEFIVDGDQAALPKIKEHVKKIAKFANVTFLKKKEIENYFLKISVLRELILWKNWRKNNGINIEKQPNESTISRIAIETAKETIFYIFKDNLLRKTLRANFPIRDALIKIDNGEDLKKQIIQSIEETIEEWKSRLDQLEEWIRNEEKKIKEIDEEIEKDLNFPIIPGKIFLDEFCKKFGFRFKKMREEYEILMKSMSQDLIDDEIKEIFQKLMTFD